MKNDQPEMLPGTEDSRSLTHPMWTPPREDDPLAPHIRALRQEIAKRLTPFDGRPNSDRVTNFCRHVYRLSETEPSLDTVARLLGLIVWHRYLAAREIEAITGRPLAAPRPQDRSLSAQGVTIRRLAEDFTGAICQSLDLQRR